MPSGLGYCYNIIAIFRRQSDQIITLLAQPLSHLHRIEALLRRLSRAVLMHLELEACFLEPAMQTVPDPGGEKLQSLRDGYKNLRRAVMTATDFLQREKLRHPDLTLSAEQQKVITHLVNDIGTRLQVEDPLYQQFHGGWKCT